MNKTKSGGGGGGDSNGVSKANSGSKKKKVHPKKGNIHLQVSSPTSLTSFDLQNSDFANLAGGSNNININNNNNSGGVGGSFPHRPPGFQVLPDANGDWGQRMSGKGFKNMIEAGPNASLASIMNAHNPAARLSHDFDDNQHQHKQGKGKRPVSVTGSIISSTSSMVSNNNDPENVSISSTSKKSLTGALSNGKRGVHKSNSRSMSPKKVPAGGGGDARGGGGNNQDINFSTMPVAEFNMLFEKLLDEMNLKEEQKEMVRKNPIETKRTMLAQNMKLHKTSHKDSHSQNTKYKSEADYANYLKDHQRSVTSKDLAECIKSLRVELSCKPVSWVTEFGKRRGHIYILEIIRTCSEIKNFYKRPNELMLDCVNCIHFFMNTGVSWSWSF